MNPHRKLLVLIFMAVALGTASQAADISWTNTAGGNWTTASNWSPNQVPGASDNAFITNSGTYTVTVSSTLSVNSFVVGGDLGVQTLSLGSGTFGVTNASVVTTNGQLSISGGTLTGSGNLTNSGVLNWTGGTMSGSGQTINAASGTLNLSGPNTGATRTLGRVLQNDGTTTWTDSKDFSLNNGTFNNNGSFTVSNSVQLECLSGGGVNAFNNVGNFTKLGAGELQFSAIGSGVSFNNSGSFTVNANTWARLLAGGTHTGEFDVVLNVSGLSLAGTHNFAGSCDVTGAGYLHIAGGLNTFPGTVNLGSSIIGAGGTFTFTGPVSFGFALQVSGGTLNFNGTTAVNAGTSLDLTGGTANLGTNTLTFGGGIISGGTLTGSGNITNTGLLNWTGGTMSGSGQTINAAGGTLNLSGTTGANRTLSLSRVLHNHGSTIWTDSKDFYILNGSTFNNHGNFTASNSVLVECLYTSGLVNAFNNFGTFIKQGAGELRFAAAGTGSFTNSGAVEAQGGTLNLSCGFAQVAGSTILNGGNLSSTKPLVFQGGMLNGVGNITANVFSGGVVSPGLSPGLLTISGNYTQAVGGVLNIEIAGNSPGTAFDRLAVNGTASLAGTVNMVLTNGFYPATNANFVFLTAGTRTGGFSTFNFPSDEVGMQLVYTSTNASVQVTNTAPVLDSIPDFTVNPGQVISFTSTATDAEVTVSNLTFSLVSPPVGATISSGGAFHWRPSLAQAGTTNQVQIRVEDNAAPPLSDTSSFNVLVNPLSPILLTPLEISGAGFRLEVQGPAGPDYIIMASSNLNQWTDIATNLSPATPFEFTDANAGGFADRYYRARITTDPFTVLTVASLITITNPEPEISRAFGIGVAAVGTDRFVVGRYPTGGGVGNPYTNVSVCLYNKEGSMLVTFTNPVVLGDGNGEGFGETMANLGDDRVIIAARAASLGKVYLFSTNGALLTTFTNPVPEGPFGLSVAALGSDRVLVGGRLDVPDGHGVDFLGRVYVFNTNGTLLTTITNPVATSSDSFGESVVAVGADRLLIGAYRTSNGASGAGAAYLFNTNGSLLTTFTNPAPGMNANFGRSLALLGSDRLLIGAASTLGNKTNAGAAYLFSTNGNLLTTFASPTPKTNDAFGFSVAALGDDKVVIGDYRSDASEVNGGAVYVFSTGGALLTVLTNPTPSVLPFDAFGQSVATVGNDRVVVGAEGDGNGSGSAYIYRLQDE